MVTDICGYSALMEEDEGGVYGRVQALSEEVTAPLVGAHGGRVVKNTGDGFIAAFSDPTAALRCGLEIQDEVVRRASERGAAPILFRAGIHYDEVIVDRGDVFGDAVNLTARLQAIAEPGGIVLSGDAAAAITRGRGSASLSDLGVVALKNLRRAVQAFAVPSRAPTELWRRVPAPAEQDRPAILVLPFRMIPEERSDPWFSEGVIEGVIHVLSGIQDLTVIARGTSLAYAGSADPPSRLAHELGVRYVLTGTVWRSDDRLRMTTTLTEGATGRVVRSDRLEGRAPDLFAMQDEIASQVVRTVAPAVRQEELSRALRKPPNNLSAYDLMLRGLSALYGLRRQDFDRARGLFQQAIGQDPTFAPVHSHAATWHNFRIGQGWSPDWTADARQAGRLALTAIELAPNDALGLAIHGQTLSFTRRDYESAQYFLALARELGPSSFMAWTLSSATSNWTGQGDVSIEQAMHALRLSPKDPFAFFAEHMVSQGYYVVGRYEDAVRWGWRSARHNGLLTSNLRTLAAALVALAEVETARSVGRRIVSVEPGFSLARFAARSPLQPSILKEYVARLRVAGLPE